MNITGTASDDRLDGSADADTIRGLDGSDSINGGDGDDTIDGGDGSDYIQSGYGSDVVQGGNGDDSIDDIGDGSDTLNGGAGDDSIRLRHSSWSQPTAEIISIDAGVGNDRVDYSAMHFYLASSTATIDLGPGDDWLKVETDYRDSVRLSLGSGRDTILLGENGAFPNAIAITDFAAGGIGDAIDLTPWITAKLYGWNGGNPFAGGHLRLVQVGVDTVLEVDGDGPIDPNASWRALVRFENTTTNTFTAANLGGWRPDGAAPTATNTTGTAMSETFSGTIGDDTIRGQDGIDAIQGGAGNDRLYGGKGSDFLEGGPGSDLLDGGEGDDYLSDTHGGSDALYGGVGDDRLYFSHADVVPSLQTIRIDGGAGNDEVDFYNAAPATAGSLTTINLGDGADRLVLGATGAPTSITLGRGRDTVVLRELTTLEDAPTFTDFAAGSGGDVIDVTEHLQRNAYNWDGSNPFGMSGLARLVQAGPDTLLQLDLDGAATYYAFTTVAAMRNVDAARLTADNFAGFAPRTISLAEAATVAVAVPGRIAEDGGGVLSLSLNFTNVSQVRGTVTLSFAAAGSTATNGLDVTLPNYSEDYAIPPMSVGQYTFVLPTIAVLADNLAEGTETLAVTIRASGQMFDTGTDSKTVLLKIIDSGQTGGTGNDTLTGTRFADDLSGGAGDDRLTGGAGNDRIDGGTGFDTAVYTNAFRQTTIALVAGTVTVTGPEGTDIVTGTERFQFADGRFILDPDSDGAKLQRLYDASFHVAPDQPGLEYWLNTLHDHGWTTSQVANAFLHSPQFQASGADIASDVAFVDFLYEQVLRRAPDAGGRANWVNALGGGLARSDALLLFSESAEHRVLTAGLTTGGYVETDDAYQAVALLYDTFAGRLPDAGGLIAWAGALKSGAMTLQQVAAGFAASDEFRVRTAGLDHGQFVDLMYRTSLNREPDAAGRANWINALDHGFSTGDILLSFSESFEHQNLMAPYIYGGITVL